MAAETIDVQTAAQMWRLGDVVIDVRSPGEYALGHIAGALNIPIDVLPAALAQLPDGRAVITTCTYGRRAARAAHLLSAGGRTAFAIAGGTKAWQSAGLPTVTGALPGDRQHRPPWRRRHVR